MHRDLAREFRLLLLAAMALLSFGLLGHSPTVSAEEAAGEAEGTKFVRVRRDDDGQPLALETAITRYRKPGEAGDGPTVDLIGAIHVGDKAYFDRLNRAFEEYDVVLYELVAPKDAVPQPGQRSAHPVSAIQLGMTNMLDLEFQLDCIDYKRKNFRHADFSPEEFSQSMKDRGESPLKIFFRMMGQSIAQQSKDASRSSDAQFLAALFSRDRSLKLKRLMANQFEDMTATAAVFEGPEGSTILTERNKRALAELAKVLGDGSQRIAIFYGAAHLPDMETRLRESHGMEPQSQRWLTAWTLGTDEG